MEGEQVPDGQVPTTPTTVQLPSALSIISVWPNWTFPTGHETQEQEVSKQLGRICATPGAARAATARRKRKPVVHGQQLLKGITLGRRVGSSAPMALGKEKREVPCKQSACCCDDLRQCSQSIPVHEEHGESGSIKSMDEDKPDAERTIMKEKGSVAGSAGLTDDYSSLGRWGWGDGWSGGFSGKLQNVVDHHEIVPAGERNTVNNLECAKLPRLKRPSDMGKEWTSHWPIPRTVSIMPKSGKNKSLCLQQCRNMDGHLTGKEIIDLCEETDRDDEETINLSDTTSAERLKGTVSNLKEDINQQHQSNSDQRQEKKSGRPQTRPRRLKTQPKRKRGIQFQVQSKSQKIGSESDEFVSGNDTLTKNSTGKEAESALPLGKTPEYHDDLQVSKNCKSVDLLTTKLCGRENCGYQRTRAVALVHELSNEASGIASQKGSTIRNAVLLFSTMVRSSDSVVLVACGHMLIVLTEVAGLVKDKALMGGVMYLTKILMEHSRDNVSQDGSWLDTSSGQYLVDSAADDLLKMRKNSRFSETVPQVESGCPCSLALIALRILIDNNQDCTKMESQNESIQATGVFDALCDTMVSQWRNSASDLECLPAPGTIVDVERKMWKVQLCLDLLACLTNSSGPCQKQAISKQVASGSEGHLIPLPLFVAHQLVSLRPFFQDIDFVNEHDVGSMQGILAFLMNLAHDSGDCGKLLGDHGVIEACADLAVVCCGDLTGDVFAKGLESNSVDKSQMIQKRVLITAPALECALGLLINVCRNSNENQSKLVRFKLAGSHCRSSQGKGDILGVLSKVLLALNPDPLVEPSQLFLDGDAACNRGSGELVSMCIAILLGYLIENDLKLQDLVADLLWPAGLQLAVDKINLMVDCCSSQSSPVRCCDTSALMRILGRLGKGSRNRSVCEIVE